MSWTLCTSGSAISFAGSGANSTIILSGSTLQDWADKSEGYIVAVTRRDWVDSYSSVDPGVKGILGNVCAAMVAKKIVTYDMSGYSGKREAETILDVLDDEIQRGLTDLKDFKSNEIKSP